MRRYDCVKCTLFPGLVYQLAGSGAALQVTSSNPSRNVGKTRVDVLEMTKGVGKDEERDAGSKIRKSPSQRSQAAKHHSCTSVVKEQRRSNVPIPSQQGPSIPIAVCVVGLLATFLCPFLSSAVDHPVDHFVLGIPSPVPDIRYFVAGGICAAASHGVTTPVDVVKTRMQANPNLRVAGLQQATLTIVQEEGLATLLQGLGPTIWGYGIEGGLKFGLYESMKPTFAQLLQTSDTAVPYLLASVAAGAAASIVLCPMEQLRIRAVTDPNFGGLNALLDENGVVGLFRGLPSMLSKQVPYTFGKQVSFDEFASSLYGWSETTLGLPEYRIKYEVSVVAAFLASMVACILSHPGDVILTGTYKKSTSTRDTSSSGTSNRGFIDVVQSIYQEQGPGGFVSGISARFVHVGVIVTSQLVLYDTVKQLLGLPATGTH